MFSGTPGTWEDRGQRSDLDETSEVTYSLWGWGPIVIHVWLIRPPRYRDP